MPYIQTNLCLYGKVHVMNKRNIPSDRRTNYKDRERSFYMFGKHDHENDLGC